MLAPAPAEIEADTEAAVLEVLNTWAYAWSSKNVGTYLSYYVNNFKAPGAARVKVVVASVMQPTSEYQDQPNGSL